MLRNFSETKIKTFSQIEKEDKTVKVICVDENRIILSCLVSYVRALLPEAEVVGFENTESASAFAENRGCDILFTEIEIEEKPTGIALARALQEKNPRINIIFATVCSEREYAQECLELRPSAYLTKVVTKKDIKKALSNLLYI